MDLAARDKTLTMLAEAGYQDVAWYERTDPIFAESPSDCPDYMVRLRLETTSLAGKARACVREISRETGLAPRVYRFEDGGYLKVVWK